MRRILTVGLDEASNREAIAAAEAHEEVFASVGRHPNSAQRVRRRGGGRHRGARGATSGCVAIGETGLDYYRDSAPTRRSSASAFEAQIAIARAHRAAAGDPPARPAGDRRCARPTPSRPWPREAEGVTVILHCCSVPPDRIGEADRARAGTARSPATSPTRSRTTCARRRAWSRTSCCWPRPTRRSSRRSRFAASRTSRPTWSRWRELLAAERGVSYGELERHRGGERGASIQVVSTADKKPGRPRTNPSIRLGSPVAFGSLGGGGRW